MITRFHWLSIATPFVASGINAGLLVGARAIGLLEGVSTPQGQPITIAAVVAATQFAALGAITLRFMLRYSIRSRPLSRRVFLGIAAAVLVASFVTPAVGLHGEAWSDVIALDLMHIVAAAASVVAAELAVRPRWSFGSASYAERALTPRTALVTGATSGIGSQVALLLANRGFRVIGVGRDARKAAQIAERAKGCPGSIVFAVADLTREIEIRRVASEAADAAGPTGFGLVVHCAGVLKPRSVTTTEGIDENFAASFLGRWRLHQLLSLAPGHRSIVVGAAERAHSNLPETSIPARPSEIGTGLQAHRLAQCANDVWVGDLIAQGANAIAYGPGAVETSIRREIPLLFRLLLWPVFVAETRTARDAALDVVRLALDASLPSSGFADREGFFHSPTFATKQTNHHALRALCTAAVSPTVPNA